MHKFKFKVKQKVLIKSRGITGEICGTSEGNHAEDQYQVYYQKTDGSHTAAWFFESDLFAIY